MVRHYVLTLNGASQNLLTAAGVTPGTKAAAAIDVPLRSISLQPRGTNNSPVYVGGVGGITPATPVGTNSVSSTDYGVRLEAGDTNDVPPAPWTETSYESGAVKLSHFNVIGADGEFLHVQGVTY